MGVTEFAKFGLYSISCRSLRKRRSTDLLLETLQNLAMHVKVTAAIATACK